MVVNGDGVVPGVVRVGDPEAEGPEPQPDSAHAATEFDGDRGTIIDLRRPR